MCPICGSDNCVENKDWSLGNYRYRCLKCGKEFD